VRQRLARCQRDADLAAVRDNDWLAAMPEADCQRWQKSWVDVEALLQKTREKP